MSALKRPDFYTPTFAKNRKRYRNLRDRMTRRIDKLLVDPFAGTELLSAKGDIDLRGLRSARLGRNFRIIFCVLDEYRKQTHRALPLLPRAVQEKIPQEKIPPQAVIFLTIGPHQRAYTLK